MDIEFDIKVNQSISFYNVLGGDKELLGDKNEFEENEEKREEDNKEEKEINKIMNKKKRKKNMYL